VIAPASVQNMVKHLSLAFTALSLLLVVSCTTKHYRKSADKEVAGIIASKTPRVPNMDTNFTIEMTNRLILEGFPVLTNSEEAFGAEQDLEKGARVISLTDALDLAVKFSRTYQNRKESVYLGALTLTLERHRYTPIFSGGASIFDQHTRTEIENGIATTVSERHDVTVGPSASMDVLLRTGGRIATDFSYDFLRFFTGNNSAVTSSRLAGTLTQPLLRGAGYKIATERLTQAERNLLYTLREFTRFRKEFAVEIASSYYGVLQNRDAVRNNWRGLQNFRDNVAREKAFFEEGLRSQASLDQLKQAELQTESKWIAAVRAYRQSLDAFKVQLGIRPEDKVVLADRELEDLKIQHPSLTIDEAGKVAMVSRLDLYNQRDEFEDAERHIKVAANGLLPQVDLILNGSMVNSGTKVTGIPKVDSTTYQWNAGAEVDLPLDRKAQRNDYRASLIAYERAKRDVISLEDTVKLQISDDWRNLDQARRNYEISELGVNIALRRVEEQQLRQELGRGTSRDLVDAENDLIDSKNQRTAALVSHTIARLKFYRDMGILWIRDNGQWDENSTAKK
jgi:outer membrane protein TolC